MPVCKSLRDTVEGDIESVPSRRWLSHGEHVRNTGTKGKVISPLLGGGHATALGPILAVHSLKVQNEGMGGRLIP